jgi:hypothetical protein
MEGFFNPNGEKHKGNLVGLLGEYRHEILTLRAYYLKLIWKCSSDVDLLKMPVYAPIGGLLEAQNFEITSKFNYPQHATTSMAFLELYKAVIRGVIFLTQQILRVDNKWELAARLNEDALERITSDYWRKHSKHKPSSGLNKALNRLIHYKTLRNSIAHEPVFSLNTKATKDKAFEDFLGRCQGVKFFKWHGVETSVEAGETQLPKGVKNIFYIDHPPFF